MNIAIDGPSASGKGTIARRLAEHFHLSYLDTGALYRAVAKHILDQGKNPDSPEDAVASAIYVRDHLSWEMLEDQALRNDIVADATSRSSQIPAVREILKDTQRQFAQHPPHKPDLKPWAGSILDGRDIGTVVCPDATIKFFITASPEVRADRRTKELLAKGIDTTYKTVLLDMLDRDARDRNRSVAPARAAEDAIILDTSDLTADAVFEKACDLIKKKLA
ncbi:MAG: cytidylate kinase [Alphaproteobacteria bacterium CG1_02_46_17]|nr:MAG: cytidylate kinase [Alphaproteobacteria bacterium CG1_02_46_17]